MVKLQRIDYPKYDYWCYGAPVSDTAEGIENMGDGPVVAIILDKFNSGTDYALNRCYIDMLIENGLSVAFITHENPADQLAKVKPAGMLLPGGFFQIPPEFIDAPYVKKELDLRHFDAYMTAFDYAHENTLPTFGICAGMQMIACKLGGKTIGGPLGKVNAATPPIHMNIAEFATPSKRDLEHIVSVEKDSLLYKITKTNTLTVTSRHNSKIVESTGGDFKITARAPDGVIEAIEPLTPWNEFVLGVQWHPEKIAVLDASSADAKLFQEFARVVKGSQ